MLLVSRLWVPIETLKFRNRQLFHGIVAITIKFPEMSKTIQGTVSFLVPKPSLLLVHTSENKTCPCGKWQMANGMNQRQNFGGFHHERI